MKINKIHIDGFGKFNQLSIEEIQPALTIFKGANEAGKSTLLAFIRRMLFGFPTKRTSVNKYPPLDGGNHGGKLVFTTDSGEMCTVERYAGRQNIANVTLPDGSNGGVSELSNLLGNADQDIFENIYAFGLDELQNFDTLNNESLRDKLYSAGLGTGSISGIQKSLVQQQTSIYKKSGKIPTINKLFTDIKKLDGTINDLEKDQDKYDSLHMDFESKSKSIGQLDGERLQLKKKLKSVENMISVWDDWRTFQDSQRYIEKLPAIGSFPDNGISQLEQILDNVNDAEEIVSSLKQDMEKNNIERTNLIINEELLQQKDTIMELGNGIEKYRSERGSLPEKNAELRAKISELHDLLKELGPQWDEAKLNGFDPSIPAKETVIQKHKAIEEVDDDIKEVQNKLAQVNRDIEITNESIRDIEKKIKNNTVEINAEKVEQGLSAIRGIRRKYNDHRDKKSELKDTEREEAYLSKTQPESPVIALQAPLWPINIIIFAGIISLVYGYFIDKILVGIIMLILLTATAVAYFVSTRRKQSDDYTSVVDNTASEVIQQKAQTYSGIIQQLRDDIESLNSEMLTYAKQCGFDKIPDLELLDQKYDELKDNASKIKSLSDLNTEIAGLSPKLNMLNRQNDDLKDECDAKNKNRTEIYNEWKDWLSTYDLSTNLSTESVLEIFSTIKACYDKQKTIQSLESQIDSIEDSIQNYEGRIISVIEQCERVHSDVSLDTELEKLRTDVDIELGKNTQTKQLAEANDTLLVDLNAAKDKYHKHHKKLSELLSSGSSDNENEFRNNAQIWADRVKLYSDIENATIQIKRISGDDELYDHFISALKIADFTELEQKRDKFQELLGGIENDISANTDERGAIRNQIKQLESRKEGAMYRMEKEALKEDLHNISRDWAAFVLAQEILRMAIEVYERERQPAVMLEAQSFFSNITHGRYNRIYSPPDSSDIFVKDSDEKRKSIFELSRGTAEQLYLALRFGFIEEFRKHSESLPIVFDDILVNFDPLRSTNAADAIKNLAKTNQIFFFTCHPETVDILKDSVPDAQVIDLDQF